ncbi:MAG: carbon storage regulator CsrA [Gemmataceae bacterium]|nr:carbon storage regulator CsrA [Gemmataceae bacterium]MCS7269488.1 carbon storage regulator CsrA [Gemmataceae bacterium]MDW8242901.1 carbon storage regulator CsrA [Thermogemmata sp.]
MLVLTRRQGESIIIGNDVRITVVSLGPGRVKLGIEAPPHVRVDREEIHARIVQEQAADVLTAVAAEASANANEPHTAQLTKTEVLSLSQRKPR